MESREVLRLRVRLQRRHALADAQPESAELLKPQQLASLSGISTNTLRNWRATKKGPPYIKDKRLILYPVVDFREWLLKRRVTRS